MKKSKKLPFLNIADEQGNVLFGDSLGDLLKKGHGADGAMTSLYSGKVRVLTRSMISAAL